MSKSFKFKNDYYLEAISIMYGKERLDNVLNRSFLARGSAPNNANDGIVCGMFTVVEDKQHTVLKNYPIAEGNGCLFVFLISRGLPIYCQIFIHYSGISYIRMNWYGTWQQWRGLT